MKKNKPRGSTKGLLSNRELTKESNTKAMWDAVYHLKKIKPNELWKYKDVWGFAGLKSSVALNSPWNQDIKDTIDAHNSALKEPDTCDISNTSKEKTLSNINKELREALKKTKRERDQALSLIATYEADALYFKNEYEMQKKTLERLRKQLNKLTSDKKAVVRDIK